MSYSTKLLTISIAAYNASAYIEKALDSCLIDELEIIDVIVVDDGSTDETAKIAQEYEKKYPNSFRLIRKENGGYGSTVNVSIELAKGKYFKLLDSDDWFDKAGLSALIKILAECDCDLVASPYVKRYGKTSVICDPVASTRDGIHEFKMGLEVDSIPMHSITYATHILREVNLILPEHRMYTDTLYDVIPLANVKSIFVTHYPVYQYRLDREGQSVSPIGVVSHREDMLELIHELMEIYQRCDDSLQKWITQSWILIDVHQLLQMLFFVLEGNALRQERDRVLSLLGDDPDLLSACKKRSKWVRILSQVPELLFPVAKLAVKHVVCS